MALLIASTKFINKSPHIYRLFNNNNNNNKYNALCSLINFNYPHHISSEKYSTADAINTATIASRYMFEVIANSTPVTFTKENLITFHEWSHLPWYGEIALITLAGRCLITLPLTIHKKNVFSRYSALQSDIQQLLEQYKIKHNIHSKSSKSEIKACRREVSVHKLDVQKKNKNV